MKNMDGMSGHEAHPPQNPHRMMIVGEKSIFLSHLPMFMSPHNFQVILEATFTNKGSSVQEIYTRDRQSHPQTKMYTLDPQEDFKLTTLFTPDPPARNTFRATVFRGHVEKGGQAIAGLTNIEVNVKRVILASALVRGAEKPEKLSYTLFGKGTELFLAHLITAPPDFDQILSVECDNVPPEDEMLRGVRVVILDRENTATHRIREQEKVSGQGHVTGAHQFLDLHVEAKTEFYFEEGELSSRKMVDGMFDPTPEETKAGFGT
jgi:hypothetical protein